MDNFQASIRTRSREMVSKLNEFTKNYLICALWASHEDDGEPLDMRFNLNDFHPNALTEAIIDCHDFVKENGIPKYTSYSERFGKEYSDAKLAGHDFWLTRNHHGAGFWDRDELDNDTADRLTKASHKFCELDVMIGDDGMLHFR